MSTIALLTDFGLQDHYAGVLKAVILRINPKVKLVDLCHQIPPQDILQGALTLKSAYRYFPKKTIFLAVVDPGVGSKRNAIILKTKDHVFVAPDNGILSPLATEGGPKQFFQIINERYFLHPVSNTFHGRDVFAPVAAFLSKGIPPAKFGPELKRISSVNIPKPRWDKKSKTLLGSIIHMDRFGNLTTNIEEKDLADYKRGCVIRIKDKLIKGLRHAYTDAENGQVLAIINSSGYLEIAVSQGSASQLLNVKKGETVSIIS